MPKEPFVVQRDKHFVKRSYFRPQDKVNIFESEIILNLAGQLSSYLVLDIERRLLQQTAYKQHRLTVAGSTSLSWVQACMCSRNLSTLVYLVTAPWCKVHIWQETSHWRVSSICVSAVCDISSVFVVSINNKQCASKSKSNDQHVEPCSNYVTCHVVKHLPTWQIQNLH